VYYNWSISNLQQQPLTPTGIDEAGLTTSTGEDAADAAAATQFCKLTVAAFNLNPNYRIYSVEGLIGLAMGAKKLLLLQLHSNLRLQQQSELNLNSKVTLNIKTDYCK
jgi:hypothetical protein